jgi:hypothetical protein
VNRIRRIAVMLPGLACALVAFAAAAPAALASVPPGWNKHPPLPSRYVVGPLLGPNRAGYPPVQLHTVVTGGMPGWQITLIAAGAALLAVVVTVLLDRARAARRHITAPTA